MHCYPSVIYEYKRTPVILLCELQTFKMSKLHILDIKKDHLLEGLKFSIALSIDFRASHYVGPYKFPCSFFMLQVIFSQNWFDVKGTSKTGPWDAATYRAGVDTRSVRGCPLVIITPSPPSRTFPGEHREQSGERVVVLLAGQLLLLNTQACLIVPVSCSSLRHAGCPWNCAGSE